MENTVIYPNTGCVYKLYAEGQPNCYIGSSRTTLEQRLYQHKLGLTTNGRSPVSKELILEYGKANIKIIALEENIIEDKLFEREQWWILNTPNTVNKKIPQLPEMSQATSEGKKAYMRKYRSQNTEIIKAKAKEYRHTPEQRAHDIEVKRLWVLANIEKVKANKQVIINCERCNAEITKGNKWRHDKKCT
jgi:GIY-YIG catalytic domain